VREHVTGRHLSPVFRSTVPRIELVQDLRYRALRWLAETLFGVRVSPCDLAKLFTIEDVFGPAPIPLGPGFAEEMVDFCNSVGAHYPSAWPSSGTLHPAMLLHWRVQCAVLNRLSAENRKRYVGLLASEVVAGRRLAEYPNRAPAPRTSPYSAEGSQRGRRGFAVVSDPQYASGCPIPREPMWELEDRDPFLRAPEETVSPRGMPEMPGGRDSVRSGSGRSRDDSRGGPPQVVGHLTRVKLPQDRPPVGPAVEPSREEDIFSLDPPLGPTRRSPRLCRLRRCMGRSLGRWTSYWPSHWSLCRSYTVGKLEEGILWGSPHSVGPLLGLPPM
jgi:hypothetical protein